MTTSPPDPLILTLRLDPVSQALFDRQRRQYFPPSRNLLPAHVTMFHHLPGDCAAEVVARVDSMCCTIAPAAVAVTGLRFLGRGVAYVLDTPAVAALRADLARGWAGWLTPQDRQRWLPHVTIQNKAAAEDARQCLSAISASFSPFTARADGIDIWFYRGGPWEWLASKSFRVSEK